MVSKQKRQNCLREKCSKCRDQYINLGKQKAGKWTQGFFLETSKRAEIVSEQ